MAIQNPSTPPVHFVGAPVVEDLEPVLDSELKQNAMITSATDNKFGELSTNFLTGTQSSSKPNGARARSPVQKLSQGKGTFVQDRILAESGTGLQPDCIGINTQTAPRRDGALIILDIGLTDQRESTHLP